MVVGIGYQMRQGKDTIANYLVEKYGFTKISFASALKKEVGDPNKVLMWVDIIENVVWLRKSDNLFEIVKGKLKIEALNFYAENGDLFHYENYDKKVCMMRGVSYKHRALLQFWGTEYRRAMDEDYWVNKVAEFIKASDDKNFVIPDVRFMNEFEYIQRENGIAVKVFGRDVGGEKGQSHQSETELAVLDDSEWDVVIKNHKTISNLYWAVDETIGRMI